MNASSIRLWNEGDNWINTYGDGSTWSLSYIGGTGNDVVLTSVTVVIPEPSRALLLLVGISFALLRRRRND